MSTADRMQWKQDAQLSQRDRTAGCVIVLAKSGRLEPGTGRQYFTDIIGLSSTTEICQIWRKKQNKG